ncbi:hypothetical protein ATO6_21555 [Oceanicola sp. 22II-s10i]|uniref:periplasmic heavy metal sensor n=1 Tax=Oceanicola sp. 22II-s10i TaxID=1317116 RepID=UPI000B527811|nr:periplasmic heavy metal sensor [Oceanicola sp. 22II-s10i]OWU82891.1 hypothetical protein ATO6_21555 [Oceanicola sp. 22II-s10i]
MNDKPEMTPAPDAKPTRLRPWLKVLFAASLALNLLIVGVAGGLALFHGPDGDHRKPPRVDRYGGPLTGALTREDKRAIWQELRAAYREGRPSRDEMRAEFATVVQALRADPYDPTVVEDSLNRQYQMAVERQRLGQDLLMKRLREMSPDERRAFADRLEEGMNRRRSDKD